MGMKNRIKAIRQECGLTQQEFANRIGVKQSTIATYESGRNEPIDAVISLICREFGVNEIWLRTGSGNMRQPTTQEERIASFVGNALQDEPESIRRQLLADLSMLTPDDWAALATIARHVTEERAKRQKEQADTEI